MNTASTQVGFEAPEHFFCHDNALLTQWQQQAWDDYCRVGLPNRRQEKWKYTDLSRLLPDHRYTAMQAAIDFDIPKAAVDGHRVVMCSGQLIGCKGVPLPDGVSILPLSQALEKKPDAVIAALTQPINHDCHPLAAVNAALLSDGVWVDIADAVNLEQPIIIEYHAASNEDTAATHYRHVVVAGVNSRCQIIEMDCASGMAPLLNTHLTLLPQQEAIIQHMVAQCAIAQNRWIAGCHSWVAKDAQTRHYYASLGAALGRFDLHGYLQESGASCVAEGLFVLTGNQHVDYHIDIDHLASNTYSDQFFKGLLADRAHGVFNGKAMVAKGLHAVSALQANHNILLSKRAEMNTKPELEIYSDEVKCSHGATIGQLDDRALFYLRSRGIGEAKAKQLLTQAFLADALSRLGSGVFANWLVQAVERKVSEVTA